MRSLGGGGPPADRGIETTLWGPRYKQSDPHRFQQQYRNSGEGCLNM